MLIQPPLLNLLQLDWSQERSKVTCIFGKFQSVTDDVKVFFLFSVL